MFLDGINSFYINILSGCSMNYYPENTLSKFKVKLPYNVVFPSNEKWHVGITRFACTSIQNKQHDVNNEPRIFFKYSDLKHKFTIVQILLAVPSFTSFIYNNHSTFFQKYNDQNVAVFEHDFKNYKFIEVYADIPNGIIKIPTDYAFTPRTLFNYYFSQLTGKDPQLQAKYLKTWFSRPQESFSVPLETLESYRSLVSEYESQLNYLCIYTDIIKPRIIGDHMTRALYMQPVQNENDWSKRNVIDVKNIEYYPLESTDISEVNILFADETGEQINFNNSSFSTMVLLHFKKGI